ncbi:ribonuclease H-like domain-containing protein, partial [Tanacetum coccineum]
LASNNVVTRNRDQSNTFTDDRYKRLMSLISEKSGSSSIPANIADSGASQHMTYTIINMLNIVDVSKLNMTVGHPNAIKLVSYLSQSNRKDNKFESILMKYLYDSVILFLKTQVGIEEDLLSEPYDDRRDSRSEVSKGTYQLSQGGTEKTNNANRDEVRHPDDSISEEEACDNLESAILDDNNSESEGDDTTYQEFNNQFQSPVHVENPDNQGVNLKRSTRKTRHKWVYKVKYQSSGEVDRFKARLVAKGFNQKEGIDYEETFSPVVKIVTVRCLLTLAVHNSWPIYQLDINNAFLYEELVEENGIFVALLVCVDDIVITRNNNDEIKKVSSKFLIKDLGKLKYFLGIEVLESKGNLYLTQRKYCSEVLVEFGMLACRPCGTPIEYKDSTTKSGKVVIDNPLNSINNYHKLVGKLIYLTHTRPDISYVVHVLSQIMHASLQSHLKIAFRVTQKLVDCLFQWYFVKNLVSWKSKKQSMLAKSSAEAEYKAMNTVTCEVIWIHKILTELNVQISLPDPIHCDNSFAIQIAANPVFHEKTKHFEIELLFLREKVSAGVVKTVKVKSVDNVADIFTKGLTVQDHNKFCDKLGLYDMYKS